MPPERKIAHQLSLVCKKSESGAHKLKKSNRNNPQFGEILILDCEHCGLHLECPKEVISPKEDKAFRELFTLLYEADQSAMLPILTPPSKFND